MFKSEWQHLWHDHGMMIVLVAIALIPALYCWLYLSSMWNTYGKLADIPVALVNHDQRQRDHGYELAIGRQLVKNLKQSDALDYHEVSRQTAERGLKTGRYYMIVTIPRDFSAHATTLLSAHPQRLMIDYRISSGRNFIVSKMTTGAAAKIESKVAAQVTKLYTQQLLTILAGVKHGLQTASAGDTQLAKGAGQLQTGEQQTLVGEQQLSDGLSQLDNHAAANLGMRPFSQGLGQLASGAVKLQTGTQFGLQGASRLQLGSQTAAAKLAASGQRLNAVQTRTQNATVIANPVQTKLTDEAPVPNNGTGMAPFAIAIGLFVGGIAVGTMFDAVTPYRRPRSSVAWWSSKCSVVGLVSGLQAGLLYGVLRGGIGLKVQSNGDLFSLLLLGSLMFLTIIFGLQIWLGGFGTWLVTIILVLQLSASAGLYPVQLTSSFASRLTPYLPMTYLIDGLRHAISLGGGIGTDLIVMASILVVVNLLIIFKFYLKIHQRQFDDWEVVEDAESDK